MFVDNLVPGVICGSVELLYVHIVTCTCALTYVMCCSLEVEAWSKKYQEFRQHWAHLSAAIKGSAIEPIEVDCTANPEEVEHSTVRDLEGRQAQHLTPAHVFKRVYDGCCTNLHMFAMPFLRPNTTVALSQGL